MFESSIEWLKDATWWEASVFILSFNVIILVMCVLIGNRLVRRFMKHPVAEIVTKRPYEIVLASVSVLLNSTVTMIGFYLWRNDVIVLSTSFGLRAWLDILVLLFIMDFAMYLFHRLAHVKWLYPYIHRTHHRFEDPRPITLFALNPLENLGFGLLWIIVLSVYPASWIGITGYLFFNIVYGLIAHLGVEPFPSSWVKHPVMKWISTSTYHTQHHQQEHYNFGFYTIIWDRLFGTMSPRYPSHFAKKLPEERDG
ncbi:sterol desaturase family protein [Halalkalibacter hemicellulosilyticus]|uniref:Sterol desaturase n=1 Tax=Halalkalibacter hemicellulosilyticusJCM 9152 TaxID=1236971 RepID=W4QIW1_9BACI|nr:sterol desaturase family protein [Halalkalibacter hemicellulosilyticus]GAE32055.1 sterol desaturase [Halalkalibacter hemicellulosilyticusJCM 9152]